ARRSSPRPTAAREAKGAAGPPAARPRGRTPHPPVSVPLPSSHAGGDELLETHRLAFARGCARLDAGKAARLDEPLLARRELPAAPQRMAPVPTHRLRLDIQHQGNLLEQTHDVAPPDTARSRERAGARVPRTP